MTRQQAFNKVYKWFITDKHGPSKSENGACMYFGDDGTRCGVGVLIPKKLFKTLDGSYNCCAVEELLIVPSIKTHFDGLGLEFLQDLQSAHDQNARETTKRGFTAGVKKSLIEVAKTWKLDV